MKIINIPLRLQDLGSADCGPVCVQMVLEYFGININLDSLKEDLHYVESGTSAYDNGVLLLDKGLMVTAITAQPRLFPPDIIEGITSEHMLSEVIQNKIDKIKDQKDKDNLATFQKFITRGGKINLEIPSFSHIKNAIDSGNPVIALLVGQALGSKEGGFHFVVVSGYDDTRVHITNPSQRSSQQGWFPIERFLYALHTSTAVDFDNGTLLVISK